MLRWIAAVPLAILVSLGVFTLMAWMVDNGVHRASAYQPVLQFDLLMAEKQDAVQRRQRTLPKRPEMPQMPQVMPVTQMQAQTPVSQTIPQVKVPLPGMDTGVAGLHIDVPSVGTEGLTTSQQAIPLYRVKPEYPAQALRRNIEGSVSLRFDIDESGRAENIQVIKSEPKRIFDRSARRAISRWKFKPHIVDGQAVKQYGMTQNITFEIKK